MQTESKQYLNAVNIIDSAYKLQQGGQLVDVILKANDESSIQKSKCEKTQKYGIVHAHKFILGAASPFFMKLFNDHCMDYKESPVTVVFPENSLDSLQYIVMYIYNNCTNIPIHLCEEVLELSQLLQLNFLTFKIQSMISITKNDLNSFTSPSSKLKKNKENYKCSYSCRFCHKIFSRNDDLKTHEMRHGKPSLPCEICKKLFKTRKDLTAHAKIHCEEENVKCMECGKKFKSKVYLRKHINGVHSKIPQSFECKICNKKYKRAISYRIHIRSVHTGDRPFKCQVCSKVFASSSYLSEHAKTHLSLHPFKCETCPKVFKVKSNYTAHAKRHNAKLETVTDESVLKIFESDLKIQTISSKISSKLVSSTSNEMPLTVTADVIHNQSLSKRRQIPMANSNAKIPIALKVVSISKKTSDPSLISKTNEQENDSSTLKSSLNNYSELKIAVRPAIKMENVCNLESSSNVSNSLELNSMNTCVIPRLKDSVFSLDDVFHCDELPFTDSCDNLFNHCSPGKIMEDSKNQTELSFYANNDGDMNGKDLESYSEVDKFLL